MENQTIFKKIKYEIQHNLAYLRKSKQLTQEQLAEKCDMSVKSISDIETTRRGISLISLIKILYALDIELNKLIMDEVNNNHDNTSK